MTTAAIIQARMGSTRLPGKVMKTLEDRTVLGHVITRCQALTSVDRIVVATTDTAEDKAICQEAERYGVEWYRGSESNVLSRYYEAAQKVQANVIVRITSDCPLLDPSISDSVIQTFFQKKCDYMSTSLSGTFPRGLDTEVFSFEALERSYREAIVSYEHEHVTPYMYLHPELFRLESFANQTDQSQYRLTLDTEEDWLLISEIYARLYAGKIFGVSEILDLFAKETQLPLINQGVKQKALGE